PDEIARARALHERMVLRALELDGTSTGEHGIGTGKIEFLERELGGAVDLMRSIKRALDPAGIMNPGKIFRSARLPPNRIERPRATCFTPARPVPRRSS